MAKMFFNDDDQVFQSTHGLLNGNPERLVVPGSELPAFCGLSATANTDLLVHVVSFSSGSEVNFPSTSKIRDRESDTGCPWPLLARHSSNPLISSPFQFASPHRAAQLTLVGTLNVSAAMIAFSFACHCPSSVGKMFGK
jgi:hypothetical protein